jgi:spermidine synthase
MAKRQKQKNKIQDKKIVRSVLKIPYSLVLCFFFISGMTGLIYEILWTRMIGKIIGNSPFAVSIVLTVFMGGLGLGSYLASRYIDRRNTPGELVKIYGVLELAVGAYGLILPVLLILFKPLYALLYNHLFGHFLFYNLLTFTGCSFLLLLPVTCMGATLPVLSRFYVTSLPGIGASLGRLYGINTIGGALGSLFCGFWIINFWGVWGSLAFAILLNTVIGFSSIYLASTLKKGPAPLVDESPLAKEKPSYASVIGGGALVIFAVSGFCSMAYEVIWTKLLGLIVGPTTYSFTIVLVTFIAGLAFGSLLFGWLADRTGKPGLLLLYSQTAAALSALFISQVLGDSQAFFAKLIFSFKENFTLLMIAKSGVLFSIMFLPTVFLGATFPLVGKLYTRSLGSVGKSIGFAYSINTAGAVLGSFCAGFILIPLLGKEHSLSLLTIFQLSTVLIVGSLMYLKTLGKAALIPLTLAVLFGGMAAAYYPHWNRFLLSTGKYHRFNAPRLNGMGWMEALFKGDKIIAAPRVGDLVYFGDGIGGFTTVIKHVDFLGKAQYNLYNSGKADASSQPADMSTQTLLAHFPLLFHPNPKRVLVLGLASGISAGEALYYPIEKLDIIDINQQVVAASGFFRPWNNNVLSNPKTELIIQDGRAHMELTDHTYDVVISEPSNPWMAGLASLFTRDFFQLVKDRLDKDGIFVQWLHSYQIDWEDFALVGRTFHQVFPNSILVGTGLYGTTPDYMLVGFNGNHGLNLDTAVRNFPGSRKSGNIVLHDPRLLYSLIVSENLQKLFGEGPVNTDNRPILEFSAPRMIHVFNRAIPSRIAEDGALSGRTQSIVSEMNTNIDLQIDRTIFTLSFNNPFRNMVDLSKATLEQRARYAAVLTDYCSKNVVEDFSFESDPELQKMCVMAQIETMQNKLAVSPEKDLLLTHLGNLYGLLKQPEKAVSFFRQAIAANPRFDRAYFNLGNALSEMNQIDESTGMFRKAIQCNPYYARAYHNWGNNLAREGNFGEAEEKYRKALFLDPSYAQTHRNLGVVLKKLGRTAEGERLIEEAARLGENQVKM